MTATAPTFGALLAAYRRERGMAGYALAIESGIDHAHIYRLERGTRRPTFRVIAALAVGLRAGVMETNQLLWAAYTDAAIALEESNGHA